MLAVEAQMVAESAGVRLRIDGRGSVLTCRLDGDPGTIFAALRRSRQLLPAFRTLVPVLERTGLRLEIMAGDVTVGRVGSGVRQNALARLLRLPSTHLGK